MLQAWLERHSSEIGAIGGRAKVLVRRRLKTLVSDTSGMFPDIDPLVHEGGKKGKVNWRAEPVSPTGNGVTGFETLLDRVGPLAVAIVRQGMAILTDPDLPAKLTSVGVQPGRDRGHLDWFLASYQGGERLVTRLGEEVASALQSQQAHSTEFLPMLASDPDVTRRALAGFLEGAGETARIQAEVLGEAPAESLWHQAEATEGNPTQGDLAVMPDAERILRYAHELCAYECGDVNEPRNEVTPERYQESLEAIVERWDRRGGRQRQPARPIDLSRAMRVRLAHTLIHPEYYKHVHEPDDFEPPDDTSAYPSGESWTEVVVWFQTEGTEIIKRGVGWSLPTQEGEELFSQNLEENWKRLTRTFLDAYVDPQRIPDWSTELASVTMVRGLGDLLEDLNSRPDPVDAGKGEPKGARAPWGEPYEEHDLDATARAYWRDRDLHLTKTPEYLRFVLNPRHQRQPHLLIDSIVYFATELVDDADVEVFGEASKKGREGSPDRAAERRDRARLWIEQELEPVLYDASRRIPSSRKAQRERARLGLLNPHLDLVAEYSSSRPDDEDRLLVQEVGAVIRNAVVRATILAVGRQAREYQEDMADE